MKKAFRILMLFLMLGQSLVSRADSGDMAGAILVSFAAAKGLASISVNALEQMELEEWKDERSKTTATLGESCGFYYEARIVGDVSYNYLWLTLKNNNPTQRSFNPIEVEFHFSGGRERRPDLFSFNQVFFEPGRLYNMILPFPAKEDFKEQKHVLITVPFYGEGKKCEIPIKMIRNEKVPDTLRSTVSLNRIELDVSAGATSVSGNLAKVVGDSMGVSGFSMSLYGPFGDGLYLGLRSNGRKSISSELIQKEGYSPTYEIQAMEFNLGYDHRIIQDQNNLWHVRLGLGGLNLQIWDGTNKVDNFEATLIDLQGVYQNIFKRVRYGIWTGNYYWGGQITNSYIFTSKTMKQGTKYDGDALSFLLTIGVGI